MVNHIDVITRLACHGTDAARVGGGQAGSAVGWGVGPITGGTVVRGNGMAEGTQEDLVDNDSTAESWQLYANCLGVDPDLFFPERGASTKEAKQVCQGCVVREDCLEYALANGEKFGIWGGLSERERRRIRRQRALARAAQQSRTA